jgi:hypothetical protein
MEALNSSEMSVLARARRRSIPEHDNLHVKRILTMPTQWLLHSVPQSLSHTEKMCITNINGEQCASYKT